MSLISNTQKDDAFVFGLDCTVICKSQSNNIFSLTFDEASESPICGLTLSNDGKILYIAFRNKLLLSYEMDSHNKSISPSPLSKCFTDRRITALKYTVIDDKSIILTADRLGEIWAFNSSDLTKSVKVGGHPTTVLTDMVISPCGSLIATCDRNEKIRFTHFPQMLKIYGYALAHKSIVRSLAFRVTESDSDSSNSIVSVGWDGCLCLWRYSKEAESNEYGETIHLQDLHQMEFEVTNGTDESVRSSSGSSDRVAEGQGEDDGKGLPFKVLILNYSLVCVLFKEQSFIYVCSIDSSNKFQSIVDMKVNGVAGKNGLISLPTTPLDACVHNSNQLIFVFPGPIYAGCYNFERIGDEVNVEELTNGADINWLNQMRECCKDYGSGSQPLQGGYADGTDPGFVEGMNKRSIDGQKRYQSLVAGSGAAVDAAELERKTANKKKKK